MILVAALAVGVLFGAGAVLMLSRDLFRMAAGAVLLANAMNLFLVAAAREPAFGRLDPLGRETAADPLAQALALTAIVITFGVTSLLLALILRVHRTHGTVDLDELAAAEAREEERIEAEAESV